MNEIDNNDEKLSAFYDGEIADNEINDILSKVSDDETIQNKICLLYTSPSPRDSFRSRMPSSA